MINNKTIKLPVKNYVISLKNFMELKNKIILKLIRFLTIELKIN